MPFVRLYRLLLYAYPPALRRELGAEMTDAVEGRWQSAGTARARLRLLAWLLADFATSLPREWGAAASRGRRPAPPARRVPTMGLLHDLRLALRSLIREPAFSVGAIVTLGLGIGASTAIFSLAAATLGRPLPIPEPDRVVQSRWTWSLPDFRDLEAMQTAFTQVAAFSGLEFGLERGGETVALSGLAVTADFFPIAGVEPLVGRLIGPADDVAGAPAIAVLGERLWRRQFGASPDIVGTPIHLSQRPVTVVGVVPARFRGFSLSEAPGIFVPMAAVPELGTGFLAQASVLNSRTTVWQQVVGRLRPGVDVMAAQAEVQAIYTRTHPRNTNRIEEPVVLVPVAARAIGLESSDELRGFLHLLGGATAAALLLACATIANLMIVRMQGRRQELAVRAALGGGRRRLTQLLLAESLLVGAGGAMLGVFAARVVLQLLASYSLPGGIAIGDLHLVVDGRALGVSVAAGVLTSLLFGAAPMWQASRVDPRAALGDGGIRSSARQPLRSALVGLQVGVCVALLAASLAFGRALHHAFGDDLGFDLDRTAVVTAKTTLGRIPADGVIRFQQAALDALADRPGIAAAGWAAMRPLQGRMQFEAVIPGDTSPRSRDIADRAIDTNLVTAGFFEAMDVPVLTGRPFNSQDRAGGQRVAIVSEALSERLWPGEFAVGRVLSLDTALRDPDQMLTVVGVAGDVRRGVGTDRTPMLYLPLFQHVEFATLGDHYLIVRADGVDPASAARRAAETLQTVDAAVPLGGIQTMREHLGSTLMTHQLGLTLFALFASLAVLLTGLGLYAVIAYAVAGRAREIGIRVALGASRRTVVALTARQGLGPIAGGLALGAGLFALAAGAIRGFMFSLPVLDVWSMAAVAVGVAGLAAMAMFVPIRRALGVDPSSALRG